MNPGETVDLGDRIYLHYNGEGFEIRTDNPKRPTDVVYLDTDRATQLIDQLKKVLDEDEQSDS